MSIKYDERSLRSSLRRFSTVNHRKLSIKEAHFDEENLRLTHPKTKDYGLIPVAESKTPFPRKENPVDATLLRERLLEQLNRVSKSPSLNSVDIAMNVDSLSMSNSPISGRSESFEEHRRKFYSAEFTITRQKNLRGVMHPPAPSILEEQTRASVFTIQSR